IAQRRVQRAIGVVVERELIAFGVIDAEHRINGLAFGVLKACERQIVAAAGLNLEAVPIDVTGRRNFAVDIASERGGRRRVARLIRRLCRGWRETKRHQRGHGRAKQKLSTHFVVSPHLTDGHGYQSVMSDAKRNSGEFQPFRFYRPASTQSDRFGWHSWQSARARGKAACQTLMSTL